MKQAISFSALEPHRNKGDRVDCPLFSPFTVWRLAVREVGEQNRTFAFLVDPLLDVLDQ